MVCWRNNLLLVPEWALNWLFVVCWISLPCCEYFCYISARWIHTEGRAPAEWCEWMNAYVVCQYAVEDDHAGDDNDDGAIGRVNFHQIQIHGIVIIYCRFQLIWMIRM